MTYIADTNDPIYEGTTMYTGDTDLTNQVIVLVADTNNWIILASSGPDMNDWPDDSDIWNMEDVPNHHGYWLCEGAAMDDSFNVAGTWRPATMEDLEVHDLGAPVLEDEASQLQAIYEANTYGLWTRDGSLVVPGVIGDLARYKKHDTEANVYMLTYEGKTHRITAATLDLFIATADTVMSTASNIMHSAVAGTYTHYKGDTYYLVGITRDSERDIPMYRYIGPGEQEYSRPAHMWHEWVTAEAEDEHAISAVKRFTYVG